MMQLPLQVKRCVFENLDENKPPAIESSIAGEMEIEEIESVKEKVPSLKEPKKEKGINKNNEIFPLKKGNNLYTITSNIKTSNGKFSVTKVIEESDEKKAKILYEKEVKKELGKPRSITKLQIKAYEIGDKNCISEIIETINVAKVEKEEMSLFEQALEILCTSPYIHMFKIPSPKMGANKFHYEIYANEEHLRQSLRDSFDEVQGKIDEANFKIDELNREQRKEAEKIIGANEKFYQKMVAGAKQLSGQEIRNDKNIMKYIGKQNDEWYKTIIKIHEEEDYENKNKLSIVRENSRKILDSKDFNLYIMQLEEFDKSCVLIAARTSEQANQIGMCSEYILNLLKENTPEKDGEQKVNVNAQVIELDEKSLSKVLEDDDALNDLISRNTFTTKLISKKQFSLKKLEDFLNKVDMINNMTEKEKDIAVRKLMSNNSLSDDFKQRMDFISTMKITEKINKIKGDL